jgi:hypothetical protein
MRMLIIQNHTVFHAFNNCARLLKSSKKKHEKLSRIHKIHFTISIKKKKTYETSLYFRATKSCWKTKMKQKSTIL